jgi:diadenosine tetraphosphate (Ap4A) HIT family hydrolase
VTARAFLHDDQFFPGWVVLKLKRQATELFELARADRVERIATIRARP